MNFKVLFGNIFSVVLIEILGGYSFANSAEYYVIRLGDFSETGVFQNERSIYPFVNEALRHEKFINLIKGQYVIPASFGIMDTKECFLTFIKNYYLMFGIPKEKNEIIQNEQKLVKSEFPPITEEKPILELLTNCLASQVFQRVTSDMLKYFLSDEKKSFFMELGGEAILSTELPEFLREKTPIDDFIKFCSIFSSEKLFEPLKMFLSKFDSQKFTELLRNINSAKLLLPFPIVDVSVQLSSLAQTVWNQIIENNFIVEFS